MSKAMLTDAKIRGLKAAAGERFEEPDALVSGLRIRVTRASKTWVLRQRAGGKVRTITLGTFGDGKGDLSLAAARTKAVAVQAEIAGGKVPMPAAAPVRDKRGPTVTEAVERFMREYCRDKAVKRPEAYQWQFDKYVIPRLGDWRLAAVGKADLRDFLSTIREGHGLTTARRVGGLLKRLFNWSAKQDLIETDPMSLVDLPGKEAVRTVTLNDDALRLIWQATDAANDPGERNKAGRKKPHPSNFPWGAYFRLLMLTGQRRGEVATMRWASIDLDKRIWLLEADETKAARAHVVPLSDAAVAVLQALPRISYTDDKGEVVPSPYVLTTNGRAPIADFSKPKRWLDDEMERLGKAKVIDWRIHDLRRTVSTTLAKLGVDPFVRRRVLNHALEGVDRNYDQFDYLEPKRAALDLWAKHLAEIVDGKPDGGNVVSIREAAHNG